MKDRIKCVAKNVVLLAQHRFPAKSHESACGSYGQFLKIRTVVYMTAKNISFLLGLMLGLDHFQISEKGSPYQGSYYPYLKYIYILLQIMKIVANILCTLLPTKYEINFKSTFYLELGITVVASFMPVEVLLEREAMY